MSGRECRARGNLIGPRCAHSRSDRPVRGQWVGWWDAACRAVGAVEDFRGPLDGVEEGREALPGQGPGGGGDSAQGSVEFVPDDQQGRPGFGGQEVGSREGEQRPALTSSAVEFLHAGRRANGKPSRPESRQAGKGNGWFPWLFLDLRLAIRYVVTYPYYRFNVGVAARASPVYGCAMNRTCVQCRNAVTRNTVRTSVGQTHGN